MFWCETEISLRRQYYIRNNHLICSYLYIDRLLDSSLPHNLIQEYNQPIDADAVARQSATGTSTVELDGIERSNQRLDPAQANDYGTKVKVKRTPRDIYKVPNEETALIGDGDGPKPLDLAEVEDAETGSPVVTFAIYINLAANAVLLVGKTVSNCQATRCQNDFT